MQRRHLVRPVRQRTKARRSPAAVEITDENGVTLRQGNVPAVQQIEQGASMQFGARLFDNAVQLISSTVGEYTWTTANAAVATVTAGLVTVDGAATVGAFATITATHTSTGLADTLSIEVIAATGTPGATYTIAPLQGEDQDVPTNSRPALDPTIVVLDGSGNRVAGVNITWTPGAGLTVLSSRNQTGGDGPNRAWALVQVGGTAGDYTLTASESGGASYTFTLHAVSSGAYTLGLVSGGNQSAAVDSTLSSPIVVELLDGAGATVSGDPITWTVTEGAVAGDSTTNGSGRASATWTLGPTSGVQSLTVEATSRSAVLGVDAIGLPATAGSNLNTNADLNAAFGNLYTRDAAATGWPAIFDTRIDAHCANITTAYAANDYGAYVDTGNQNNPHYGPLRAVFMRNVRSGYALDETEPNFRDACRVTEECLRADFAANGGYVASTLVKCTAVWDWYIYYTLFKNSTAPVFSSKLTGGYTTRGQMAQYAHNVMRMQANWATWHLTRARRTVYHEWMDGRTIALAIEMAWIANRLSFPWNVTVGSGSGAMPINSEVLAAGVTSWRSYIEDYCLPYLDAIQAQVATLWGGLDDRNSLSNPAPNNIAPLPVLITGDLRMWDAATSISGGGPNPSVPEPYPSQPFMQGMVAHALARCYRTFSSPAAGILDNIAQMFTSWSQNYDTTRNCLPYLSHPAAGAGTRFKGTTEDYILNHFWLVPLLTLYNADPVTYSWALTDARAIAGRAGAVTSNFNYKWKMGNQLSSASDTQHAHALLFDLS